MLLYSRVNCGFRSIVEILKIFNDVIGGVIGKIPTRSTIENWIKKCGLDLYKNPQSPKDYALVVDESMMMGSEKLLLTLGIPAKHKGSPLVFKDVSILDMSVSSSWSGEGIKDRLLAASDKMEHSPQYIISDNASVMTKGISLLSLPHHHDISHSLGMFLERCYKHEEDFISYTASMSDAQFKHNMKNIAYLLPPRQRTIARFINMSGWVEWSQKMLNIYHKLKPYERTAYAFVPANASLIEELSEVMKCINFIEKECKQYGLSWNTIDNCKKTIQNLLFNGNTRMRKLGEEICAYLLNEGKILKGLNNRHNISSDIIESTFGMYKRRKSPNKLHGVTSFILFMPAQIQFMQNKREEDYSIKQHLENIKLSHIQEWENDFLTTNLVTKRINTLKNVA